MLAVAYSTVIFSISFTLSIWQISQCVPFSFIMPCVLFADDTVGFLILVNRFFIYIYIYMFLFKHIQNVLYFKLK